MIVQLAAVALVVFFLYLLDKKPKSYPPGPWGLPILGCLSHANVLRTSELKKLYEKYGKVFSVRFGTRLMVFMADHKVIKTTFSKAETTMRPNFFTFTIMSAFKNTGFVNANGDHWTNGRRFALRHLRDLGLGKTRIQNSVQTEVTHLIDHFKKNTGKPLEITYELNVAILNIVWQLVADRRYSLHDEKLKRFAHLIVETFDFIQGPGTILNLYPWLQYILPNYIQNKMLGVGEFKRLRGELKDYFMEIINEHVDTLDVENPRDYIDHYLIEMNNQNKNTDSSFVLSHIDLENCIFDLFAAGSETTSSSTRWMVLLLALHPEEQRKIQNLIDEVVPRSRMPCLEDRENLIYIEAMIYEVMRYSSLATQGLPHAAGADMTIGDYKVPKDSVLIPCQEILQRSPIYFEKPDQFYPGHFIGKEGQLLTKKEGFMPFAIGRRACLGESLAKAEMFLMATGLIQKFTFKPHPDHPLETTPHPARPLFNFPKHFRVVLEERKV